MKSLALLLALVGVAVAGRPESENVIETFKRVVPFYKSAMDEAQSHLVAIKSNLTNQLVDFHINIILSKEEFVQQVIIREDYILGQIGNQRTADPVCLSFVRSSSEMTVNLAGVSFTNCINAADDLVNTKVKEYFGSVDNLEQQIKELRLLDVFRGNNIFHSPEPILGGLNQKLAYLQSLNGTIFADDTTNVIATNVLQDLYTITYNYKTCMVNAYDLLAQGLNMCEMQMEVICGATLQCGIGSGPCNTSVPA